MDNSPLTALLWDTKAHPSANLKKSKPGLSHTEPQPQWAISGYRMSVNANPVMVVHIAHSHI